MNYGEVGTKWSAGPLKKLNAEEPNTQEGTTMGINQERNCDTGPLNLNEEDTVDEEVGEGSDKVQLGSVVTRGCNYTGSTDRPTNTTLVMNDVIIRGSKKYGIGPLSPKEEDTVGGGGDTMDVGFLKTVILDEDKAEEIQGVMSNEEIASYLDTGPFRGPDHEDTGGGMWVGQKRQEVWGINSKYWKFIGNR